MFDEKERMKYDLDNNQELEVILRKLIIVEAANLAEERGYEKSVVLNTSEPLPEDILELYMQAKEKILKEYEEELQKS